MSCFEKHALPIQRRELTAPLHEEIDVLKLELAERDAMLDGILRALYRMDSALYDTYVMHDGHSAKVVASVKRHYQPVQKDLDWDVIESWWADHKAQIRVREEQQAQERERRRQEILSRLSAEEREILGI